MTPRSRHLILGNVARHVARIACTPLLLVNSAVGREIARDDVAVVQAPSSSE